MWDKEFVYSQWRKLLCIFVVNRDINHSIDEDNPITNEQLRTVFNNGYKMAMLQTSESIHKAIKSNPRDARLVLQELAVEIDDRITVSNCYESNREQREKIKEREREFSEYESRSLSTWTDLKM
jgi:uncharacterized protein YneF (UPF0154 family)